MFFFLISSQFSEAQNSLYFLSQDSSVYKPLENAIVLAEQSNWPGKKLGLKLPFKFNYGGILSDSINMERLGIVYIGMGKNISFLAFNSLQTGTDVPEKCVPSVSITYSGEVGSRVVKIEFKRLIAEASVTDIFNYQLWLHESSGRIEFHLGPNTHAFMVGEPFYQDKDFSFFPERINQKLSNAVNSYSKKKLPSFLTGMLLSSGNDNFSRTNKPINGSIYIFNPLF